MQAENTRQINIWLSSVFEDLSVPSELIKPLVAVIDIVIVVALIILLNWLAKRIILTAVDKLIRKTKIIWDDIFLENKVFDNIAYIVPVISVDYLVPLFFGRYPDFINIIDKITDLAFVWVIVNVFTSIITSLTLVSKGKSQYVSIVIQSLSQLAKIVVFLFAIIVTISILLNIDLSAIFGTLGALTAIIILVFRDTILGFVASIQMSTTKMLQIGDWVAMPSYNADGPLIELNLMTAKIQNWDKTITSVPTYALISSSVKNWEGMSKAGVRRIKRSINFDVNSIKFLDTDDLSNLMKIDLLKDFILQRETEIDEFNKKKDGDITLNKRRQTNIGIFRKYAELYLINHKMISKEQTLMVRQLQANESGVPLEVYCFSIDTAWVSYEGIQSDIFDHLFATANEFGLKIFQNPTGLDFRTMSK